MLPLLLAVFSVFCDHCVHASSVPFVCFELYAEIGVVAGNLSSLSMLSPATVYILENCKCFARNMAGSVVFPCKKRMCQ